MVLRLFVPKNVKHMYFHNDYFSTLKKEAGTFSETSSSSTPNRQQNVIFGFTLLTFTNMLYWERNTNFMIKILNCLYVAVHIFSSHIYQMYFGKM